ncbi:hypothetical protein HGRIS_000530 [Hohenbuehelia grisea]|uniref:DNA mismatch repair protein S5 domain-containing protein n=1 Tax=Hohenbuehelia grisea TaxID=104357 RepID=A0ABR3JSX5_9AGAR
MDESASKSEFETLPIRRLHESLINRIAAGEIIHRPASALKELVENCLDAGSTSIKVTVKDGGLKLLQIQDNGCGIRKADLPILAERFTTSKLSSFSDLSRISTYGFRGEALASISHVSRLSVITKTKREACAWKASYSDGTLTPVKPGLTADPKPCAGNDGTTIIIEDLFYNTPTRLSAVRSSSEEYSRILDVITKYAIHNPRVSFVCKKAGSASPDVTTPLNSEVPQAIRLLYGHAVAKELLHKTLENETSRHNKDDPVTWSAESFFTNANYQAKKMVFLLFINHRLVESPRLKRALEGVYNGILPKGASPFIYLSLDIDPKAVDVNVHPTKREVHFLNEEEIITRICDAIQSELAAQSHSRTFEYQTLLTGGLAPREQDSKKQSKVRPSNDEREEIDENDMVPLQQEPPKRTASQHKVRTSQHDRTLDSMFPVAHPSTQTLPVAKSSQSTPLNTTTAREIKESQCFLTSIRSLRQALVKQKHRQLTEILENHTFVGIVDLHRCLSLIQNSTKLYLVNHGALAEELFYQLGLRQFGNFSRMKLDPPPPLKTLVEIAVTAEESTSESKLTKAQITERIVALLMQRREMLSEYFSLKISEDGMVESLPLLLRNYTPNLDKLPSFFMRLGPQVDWQSEEECFDTFFRELAYFYIPGPLPGVSNATKESKAEQEAEHWQVQHALFPAMRRYLNAPKTLLERDVVQVANLPDLYKIFERC